MRVDTNSVTVNGGFTLARRFRDLNHTRSHSGARPKIENPSPETHNHSSRLWFPGSPLRGARNDQFRAFAYPTRASISPECVLICGALVGPARPECHAKSDQEYCGQNQKECGLLEPRDRRHGESHARPRKQICKDRRLTPARKVPSASNVKSTRLVAGAGSIF